MIDEDYHSIKDDIPLVSVYTTRNVLVRGMLIPDEFLTEEIRATDDYKEYDTVFVNVVIPMNQPQPVVSTQGTHRQKKVDEGEKDAQSYDDVDDFDNRLEPMSHKENPRTVKMQNTNSLNTYSPLDILNFDKNIVQELTDTVSLSTPTTSKAPHKQRRISRKYSHLPGALRRMCRRQGYMIKNMERKCVTTD
ncbi:hypothetical protein Tco_1164972 [Tanacetum coccineum]